MFDTDLTREYAAAEQLGLDPRGLYETALAGALCDDDTRARLTTVAAEYDWESVAAEAR
jgi:aminodeoxyfutalosine deaminase